MTFGPDDGIGDIVTLETSCISGSAQPAAATKQDDSDDEAGDILQRWERARIREEGRRHRLESLEVQHNSPSTRLPDMATVVFGREQLSPITSARNSLSIPRTPKARRASIDWLSSGMHALSREPEGHGDYLTETLSPQPVIPKARARRSSYTVGDHCADPQPHSSGTGSAVVHQESVPTSPSAFSVAGPSPVIPAGMSKGKARRSSYTVGYSAGLDHHSCNGAPPPPLHTFLLQPSHHTTAPASPTANTSSLSKLRNAHAAGSFGQHHDVLSTGKGSPPNHNAVLNAGDTGPAASLGNKLRRLLQRTVSRAGHGTQAGAAAAGSGGTSPNILSAAQIGSDEAHAADGDHHHHHHLHEPHEDHHYLQDFTSTQNDLNQDAQHSRRYPASSRSSLFNMAPHSREPEPVDPYETGAAMGGRKRQRTPMPIGNDSTFADMLASGAEMTPDGDVDAETALAFRRNHQQRGLSQHLRALVQLAPFVPRQLMEDVIRVDPRYSAFDHGGLRQLGHSNKALKPEITEVQGAVMIADVKGFTQLTEILSKKGTSGVELLTNCMNNYFTRVINMIQAFDGDVVKFAGDSMIVLFSPTPAEREAEDQGIHAATLRCAQCAHVLASRLGHMRMKMNGQVEPIQIQRNSIEIVDVPEDDMEPMLRRAMTAARRNPRVSGTMLAVGQSISGAAATGTLDSSMSSAQLVKDEPDAQNLTSKTLPVLSPGSPVTGDGSIGVQPSLSVGLPAALQEVSASAVPAEADSSEALVTISGANSPGNSPNSSAAVGVTFSRAAKKASWLNMIMKRQSTSNKKVLDGAGSSVSSMTGVQSSQVSNAGSQVSMSSGSNARGGMRRGRARTDAGLNMWQSPTASRASVHGESAMWGAEGGVAAREMSLASKLNIPPPVRNVVGAGQPRASGIVGNTAEPMVASRMRPGSFSNDFARRPAAAGGQIPSRAQNSTAAPGAESWAAKFQHLQSNVVQQSSASAFEAFAIERSNTSIGGTRPSMTNLGHDAHETDPDRISAVDSRPSTDADARIAALGVTGSGPSRLASIRRSMVGFTKRVTSFSSTGRRPLDSPTSPGTGGRLTPTNTRQTTELALDLESPNSSSHPAAVEDLQDLDEIDGHENDDDYMVSEHGYKWSKDSYTVDMLAAAAASTAAGRPISRMGRSMRSPNTANIEGYMAPASQTSLAQAVAEGVETPCTTTDCSNWDAQQHPHARPAAGWQHPESWHMIQGSRRHQQRQGACHDQHRYQGANAAARHSAVAFYSRAGPVAEGMFRQNPSSTSGHIFDSRNIMSATTEVSVSSPQESMTMAHNQHPSISNASTTSKPSFMGKVMNWFGGGSVIKGLVDTWQPYDGRMEDLKEDGLQEESSGVLRNMSFGASRAPGPLSQLGLGAGIGGGGAKIRDPIMEEALQSEFSLKIMISTGSVSVFQIGGAVDEVTDPSMPDIPRWEYFIGDLPLAPLRDQYGRRRCIAQLAAIEDQAEAGMVVASQEVADLLEDDWDVEPLPDQVSQMRGPRQMFVIPTRSQQRLIRVANRSRAMRSTCLGIDPNQSGPLASLRSQTVTQDPGAAQSADNIEPPSMPNEFADLPDQSQQRLANVLRMHVLGSVRTRIEAGHLDFINEIRTLTCLFLGFPSLLREQNATYEEQVEAVQYCMEQTQHVMRKWDGSLLQFRCDEKGFVAICALGLPGHTHEDNPCRGVLAALELSSKIKDRNHRVSIGVTTGDLLCTCVGARKMRSEYTVFGDAINLSARLMVKSKKNPDMGDILCCEVTHKHAKLKAAYTELEPMQVKGKKLPVHVFSVAPAGKDSFLKQRAASTQGGEGEVGEDRGSNGNAPDRPLVGRDAETSFILNRAANMIAGMATGGAIVIEGNTGMGKTKLLSEVRRSLQRTHAETCVGNAPVFSLFYGLADTANKSNKLHPWRRTFQELLSVDRKATLQDADVDEATRSALGELPLTHSYVSPSTTPTGSAAARLGVLTKLGNRLSTSIPGYNNEWRKHLADLLEVPLHMIPQGKDVSLQDAPMASVVPGFSLNGGSNRTSPNLMHPSQLRTVSMLGSSTPAPIGISAAGAQEVTAMHGSNAAPQHSALSSSPPQQRITFLPSAAQLPLPGFHRQFSNLGYDTAPPCAQTSASGGQGDATPQGSNVVTRALMGARKVVSRTLSVRKLQAGSSTAALQAPGSPFVSSTNTATSRQMVVNSLPQLLIPGLTSMDNGLATPMLSGGALVSPAAPPGGNAGMMPLPEMPGNQQQQQGSMTPTSPAAARAKNHTLVSISSGVGPPPPSPGAIQSSFSRGNALVSSGPSLSTRNNPMASLSAGVSNALNATNNASAPLKKNSLNFLVHLLREFTSLYGPIILMLENLHEFDTWSWQLLDKVAELLSPSVLILATTRPIELVQSTGNPVPVNSRAAMHHKVAMMYRHLLQLPTTSKVVLEPFDLHQTKALMMVVASVSYPDQYVHAVMEKTGGMPLYIEKVTEFLCAKPMLAEPGGEFAANVNKMIRNLNFQQVIMERMDRLKHGSHLTLKVASVMGQWVDLDILHKFYPINKSKEELRAHLVELSRGNFLKPTDTEGVWEFNMVERDIVYEVIPHYQRRRLHAKLAQELERSLQEQHVASLTTIAYHWHQACMGHEVTETECALKAIEYWARAAEAGYACSSLLEALRLYQKAAQIAELLAESRDEEEEDEGEEYHEDSYHEGSGHGNARRRYRFKRASSSSERVSRNTADYDRFPYDDDQENNASFTAVSSGLKGTQNWNLISPITRAQWEKSMASCCLGIVMQHRLEFNQMDLWDNEDYFTLLTEHAIRGLMLLGAPHPQEILAEAELPRWKTMLCFCFVSQDDHLPSGWQDGVVLQDQEVTEIRDILLVLIIAAEHYSITNTHEYSRLLTFCKRVCTYFSKCSDSGLDPFSDIHIACNQRLKNVKHRKASAVVAEFGLRGQEALPQHMSFSHLAAGPPVLNVAAQSAGRAMFTGYAAHGDTEEVLLLGLMGPDMLTGTAGSGTIPAGREEGSLSHTGTRGQSFILTSEGLAPVANDE